MSKNPYEILGVSPTATRSDIDQAYYTLRDKYRLDMHSEGEKGKLAAKKLNELETAYRDIIIDYTGDSSKTTASSSTDEPTITSDPVIEDSVFSEVERLIREKNYPAAQKSLDNLFERNADWHFYQSAIYYKQGWLNESKSQLEIACNMDPSNKKYSDSLEKLNAKLSNSRASSSTVKPESSKGGYSRSYTSDYDARRTEDTCCQACQAAICVNCLCDCCCRS